MASLYHTLTGTEAPADIVSLYAGQIGTGKTYESQGDLYYNVTLFDGVTDLFVDVVGTIQQLDPTLFNLA